MFSWIGEDNQKRYYPMLFSQDLFMSKDWVETLNKCIKQSFFHDKQTIEKRLDYKDDFDELLK
jgi:hypothetical protein